MAQNDSVNNKLKKTDTTFANQNSTDSIYYSILLSGRTNKTQQKINVGDRIILQLQNGKLMKHTVISINNDNFVIDSTYIVSPNQIYRIAEVKAKTVKYLFGTILTVSGLIAEQYIVRLSIGVAGLIGYMPSVISVILIPYFIGGTALLTTGICILTSHVHTYNLQKGDKIIFIQIYK